MKLTIRLSTDAGKLAFSATLVSAGDGAAASFAASKDVPGVHLFLDGDRDFHAVLDQAPSKAERAALDAAVGGRVTLRFEGRRASLRRRLAAMTGRLLEAPARPEAPPKPARAALALTEGIFGAPPLFLLAEGTLAGAAEGPAPRGMDALETMVNAARWVSSRRTSSFERLFPPSAFHPDAPIREDRLDGAQAEALLDQVAAVLDAARVGGGADPIDAAQLRSASVTVLAHVIATAGRDPGFRAAADRAFAMVTALVDAEGGEGARAELRAHAIQLLAQRGPALTAEQQATVQALLRGLVRGAPPYDALPEVWRFALCAAYDFLRGSVAILKNQHGFVEIEAPADTPKAPGYGSTYTVLEAPFKGPAGQPIQIFARSASPRNENWEMEQEFFVGLMVNRHANLGSADMSAALVDVHQKGYKLMLNAQCAGLTTRFAISRMFPEADIYSSWDSTYFRTGADGELSASEGVDCLVALLQGMAKGEDFTAIDGRLRKAQWYHQQSRSKDFVQFVGPAHPLVARRYEDVNRDGKADYYDGFLDLRLVEIAEELHASMTPRDPGVAGSQIAGEAARGLGWAAGSLNRVTQYSELWDELPGQSEVFYAFRAAGFYSPGEAPQDVTRGKGPVVELGKMPVVVRYLTGGDGGSSITAEVMCHAWLSHAAQELKRLLAAADAYWRAIDLGYLGARAPLDSPLGQRGGLLILLAGLLEFPADQNMIDTLWGMALDMLGLPKISRSLVRRCINDEDHDAGNYYGSRRGISELVGDGESTGKLETQDPVAFEQLRADDPTVGRLRSLALG